MSLKRKKEKKAEKEKRASEQCAAAASSMSVSKADFVPVRVFEQENTAPPTE